MIKRLKIKNFRGHTREFSFEGSTFVKGHNGSGKSTMKEALCFAFCGTDSIGTRAPVHLISTGAEGCEVEVETEKAIISRTLSQKKNGTIKLVRNGVPNVMSQSDFENLVGFPDLWMGIAVPGFFMSLPKIRQLTVFNAVMPKIDKMALLEELLGDKLDSFEKAKVNFDRKAPQSIAADFAGDRRALQRQVDENKGRIAALLQLGKPAGVNPPAACKDLPLLKQRAAMWNQYATDHIRYVAWKEAVAKAQAANNIAKHKQDKLREEIAAIAFEDEPQALVNFQEKHKELMDGRRVFPAPPRGLNFENPMCSACGQIIGSKHKEKMEGLHKQAMEEHQAVCDEVTAHNAEIDAKVANLSALEAGYRKTVAEVQQRNDAARKIKHAKERELNQITFVQAPDEVREPTKPEVADVSNEELEAAEKAVRDYEKALAVYNTQLEQYERAEAQAQKLRDENERLEAQCARYSLIETALTSLPAEELKRQTELMAMEPYTLHATADGIALVDGRGCPYELLSSGEKMKADMAICSKLNRMTRRPLNIMFVDNADLMDQYTTQPGVQYFIALVDKGQLQTENV